MDLILVLRLAYLGAAATVLVVDSIPALHDRLLAYGPRAAGAKHEKPSKERPTLIVMLDRLACITVPHSWFASFYLVSVFASVFWATQVFTQGPAFRVVADCSNPQETTMTCDQVFVAWLLFLGHGSRRVYESYVFIKPSQSRMWFGHWVLGIAFYILTSVALWIEGIPALQTRTISTADITIRAPTLRSILSVALFFLASGAQYNCHAYLASLKSATKDNDGYKLPQHPAFARIIAPHYTAECTLYLALAIFAAPRGAWVNGTFLCALVFVGVNLGVTAKGTKDWYESRFGRKAVEGKWRVIPFVF